MTKSIEVPGIAVPPQIVDDLTRREFLVGAGLIALAPACGSDEESGQTASGETRTVEHELGTTEVPVNPQRVVALEALTIDTALTLGVEPVGVGSTIGVSSTGVNVLDDRLPDNTKFVGNISEPNIEAIAALEPDLIVGIDSNIEEIYDQLSQIAPTVGVFFGDGSGEWKQTGRAVAEALGRSEEFESELAEYTERAEGIGRRLGVSGDAPTVSVMRVREQDVRFELPGIFSGSVLYSDVGLPLPEGLREPAEAGETTLDISTEEIGRGDAEVLFLYSANEEDPEQEIEAVREDPLFQTLQAVESGDAHAVGDHWYSGNLIAANRILDDLEQHLLDGDTD